MNYKKYMVIGLIGFLVIASAIIFNINNKPNQIENALTYEDTIPFKDDFFNDISAEKENRHLTSQSENLEQNFTEDYELILDEVNSQIESSTIIEEILSDVYREEDTYEKVKILSNALQNREHEMTDEEIDYLEMINTNYDRLLTFDLIYNEIKDKQIPIDERHKKVNLVRDVLEPVEFVKAYIKLREYDQSIVNQNWTSSRIINNNYYQEPLEFMSLIEIKSFSQEFTFNRPSDGRKFYKVIFRPQVKKLHENFGDYAFYVEIDYLDELATMHYVSFIDENGVIVQDQNKKGALLIDNQNLFNQNYIEKHKIKLN